jgi:hypothetical protein
VLLNSFQKSPKLMKNKKFIVAKRRYFKNKKLIVLFLKILICTNVIKAEVPLPAYNPTDCFDVSISYDWPHSDGLCGRYPNFSPEYTIGQGTSYPSSDYFQASQITGANIFIAGNFNVNTNLIFKNCIIKIAQGVKIEVFNAVTQNLPTKVSFVLDNSKLFCCEGMWTGIQINHDVGGYIKTSNHTVIEDMANGIIGTSKKAVYSIENTRFNRNYISLWVGNNILTSGYPIILKFTGNTFDCDAPLNTNSQGYINSEAGIFVKAGEFIFGTNLSQLNTFKRMHYGVKYDVKSNVTFKRCRFENNYIAGISGLASIKVDYCEFANNRIYGVYANEVTELKSEHSSYTFSNGIPSNALPNSFNNYYGIYVDNIQNNSKINISNFNIFTRTLTEYCKLIGVAIFNSAIAGNNIINITNNDATIVGENSSKFIQISGDFSLATGINIEQNRIVIDAPQTYSDAIAIHILNGDKHNLNINGNNLDGGFDTGRAWSAITVEGGSGNNGKATQISTNYNTLLTSSNDYFNAGHSHFGGAAVDVLDYNQVLICKNEWYVNGRGIYCRGIDSDIDIAANNFAGNSRDINIYKTINTFNLHKGNLFYKVYAPPYIFVPKLNCELEDLSQKLFNIFEAHTDPGTVYFPSLDRISPSVGWWFTKDGAPQTVCATQVAEFGPLDQFILEGKLDTFAGLNIAEKYTVRNNLMTKLYENQSLLSGNTAAQNYFNTNSTSPLGQIVELKCNLWNKLNAIYSDSLFLGLSTDNIVMYEDSISNVLQAEENNKNVSDTIDNDSMIIFLTNRIDTILMLNDTLQRIMQLRIEDTIINLRNDLVNINPISHFDSTQIITNLYKFDRMLGNIDSTRENFVNTLSFKCPQEEGMVVYLARGISSECHQTSQGFYCYINTPLFEIDTILNNEQRQSSKGDKINNSLNISPNPTSGNFEITSPNINLSKVYITNILGETIFSVQGLSSKSIGIELLHPAGSYFISVQFEDGAWITQKLIIK